MKVPVIALIGRPNTGKSTLFNRLVGRNAAITYNKAGTTRDRIFERMLINDIPTLLVDTAGLADDKTDDELELGVRKQSELAIDEADIVLFVVDASQDLTSEDYEVAKKLRASKKTVLLIGSKSDSEEIDEYKTAIYALGFQEVYFLSAIHNLGIEELLEDLGKTLKVLKWTKFKVPKEKGPVATRIAFVGRPNVGKSSLINAILGKEQVLVSEVAGTTRDSVSLNFDFEDQRFVLTDTAGIRRRGKLRYEWIEKYSVLRSVKSIEASDVAVLVLDSVEKLTKQDMRVAEYILDAVKGVVIVLNKADLVKPEEKNYLLRLLSAKMSFLHFAPVIFTSALKGRNVVEVLKQATLIVEERSKMIKTKELNYFLERIVAEHPPKGGLKFKFIEQVEVSPPTFLIFVNKKDEVHFSYKRYLENSLRREFGFSGTAIDLKFK